MPRFRDPVPATPLALVLALASCASGVPGFDPPGDVGGVIEAANEISEQERRRIPDPPEDYASLPVAIVVEQAQTATADEVDTTFANLMDVTRRRLEVVADTKGWFQPMRVRPVDASMSTTLDNLSADVELGLTVQLDYFDVRSGGSSSFTIGHAESGSKGSLDSASDAIRCRTTVGLWRRRGENWVSIGQGSGEAASTDTRSSSATEILGLIEDLDLGSDQQQPGSPASVDRLHAVLDDSMKAAMADMLRKKATKRRVLALASEG